MYAEWASTMCWNDISNPQTQLQRFRIIAGQKDEKSGSVLCQRKTDKPIHSSEQDLQICLKLSGVLKNL